MSGHDAEKTIADFGEQWQNYTDNDGFYGSVDALKDILEPLLPLGEIVNSRAVDIGSGTGRIVLMLLNAGVRHVVAVEPSMAFEVLARNTAGVKERVTLLNIKGEDLPPGQAFDHAFSIGVIHHIVDPLPVLKAVHDSLRPGGRFFIWVYGKEGNELYLAVIHTLRWLTTRLSHRGLERLVRAIDIFLVIYMKLCQAFPLPLRRYILDFLVKFSPEKRRLVIYDQLNPAHAKYYQRAEIEQLMAQGGFRDVKVWQRHGYSYSVIGTRPSTRCVPPEGDPDVSEKGG